MTFFKDERLVKYQNPVRVKELDPKNTLKAAGLKDGMTVCDIGAGTGLFTFEAAKMTSNQVTAIEISEIMLDYLDEEIEKNQIPNVSAIKLKSMRFPMGDEQCDLVVLSSVFHELMDRDRTFKGINRILKPGGKLLVTEFHYRTTPLGPHINHRVMEDEVIVVAKRHGLTLETKKDLGENFYYMIFTK